VLYSSLLSRDIKFKNTCRIDKLMRLRALKILSYFEGYQFSFSMAQQPLVRQGFLIVEASLSLSLSLTHTHTHARALARTHARTHAHTHSVGLLDEWSTQRRDLYLSTHSIHKRKTSLLLAGFEPSIPARQRPQTHTLDLATIRISPWRIFAWSNHRRQV
jgi:hypothetical protein